MKWSVLFRGQLGMSMLTIAIPQFVENLRKNIQGVETTEELLIRTLIAVGSVVVLLLLRNIISGGILTVIGKTFCRRKPRVQSLIKDGLPWGCKSSPPPESCIRSACFSLRPAALCAPAGAACAYWMASWTIIPLTRQPARTKPGWPPFALSPM